MSQLTAYALGIRDRAGKLAFLRREVFPGNLMQTPDPWYAWTWQTVKEIQLWLDELPESCKYQLADRELLCVPLTASVGTPRQKLILRTVEAPPKPDEPDKPVKKTLNKSMVLFGE